MFNTQQSFVASMPFEFALFSIQYFMLLSYESQMKQQIVWYFRYFYLFFRIFFKNWIDIGRNAYFFSFCFFLRQQSHRNATHFVLNGRRFKCFYRDQRTLNIQNTQSSSHDTYTSHNMIIFTRFFHNFFLCKLISIQLSVSNLLIFLLKKY